MKPPHNDDAFQIVRRYAFSGNGRYQKNRLVKAGPDRVVIFFFF